jgi:ribosomal protein L2
LIILKKFKKIIPSFRHKTDIQIFDNSPLRTKYKLYNNPLIANNLIKRKKKLFKPFCYNINFVFNNNLNLITSSYSYNMKPYKKIITCQTISGEIYNIPGIDLLNIGQILITQANISSYTTKFMCKGILTYLWKLPMNTICCNLTNLNNTKLTFAKSGGTFCKIKKNKKNKKKLLLIELPSKQELLFTKYTKTYVGQNQNFRTNELVEGKWGFSFSLKKKIAVRGVAMNPVDHPNGGRTKTVQPERSPWNWVAKKKK